MIKPYLFSLCLGLCLLSACGGNDHEDDGPQVVKPEGGSTTPVTPANPGTAAGDDARNANPTWAPELSRLEMPRLHGTKNDTLLIHKDGRGVVNYITEWDHARKTQRWSCYVMDAKMMERHTERYDTKVSGYPDDDLLSERMQWGKDPYYGNENQYEHGHICPSADRLTSAEINFQTFFLTNMQPQFKVFNGGLWGKLENEVRAIASATVRDGGVLYVCKGGTVDVGQYGGQSRIYRTLENGLIVPRFFYMALLRQSRDGQYTAMAYWTNQIDDSGYTGSSYNQFIISIDELEARTGIDFFCNLPGSVETQVERSATVMRMR